MNVDSFILHPFDNLRSGPSAFILYLANGTHLAICAGDEAAASVVNFLARTAQLSPAPCPLPSGVGKSTATRRLPWPWRSLADDATLVVRDAAGAYWAHPWPTWSRFFGKEKGDGRDTWDVQQAVPLRAIFILEQGEEDQVEPLGPGHAVALLTELAQQTATHFLHGLPLDEIAAFNRLRFENICSLVRSVPAYTLHVSLEGAFWDGIAHVMR
jgi:SynChlorMet cassette protein ScmC